MFARITGLVLLSLTLLAFGCGGGGGSSGNYNNVNNNNSNPNDPDPGRVYIPTPIQPVGISAYSIGQDTKDVNLQRGMIAQDDFEQRAEDNSQQFSMSLESARSLTLLSDRMNSLSNAGQLTDQDRDALAHDALAIAGVDTPEVSQAIAQMANHDNTLVNKLIDRAASNLGMSSSYELRNEILPSFGVQIPNNN